VGHHEVLRPGVAERAEFKMFDYIISGIVAIFLLMYLAWAMFQPQKF
jgi:K+-transporting ATPase KdpF subunit